MEEIFMNKEEILKKAQRENIDEREEIVKDHSLRYAYGVMAMLTAFFTFLRSQSGQPTTDLIIVTCGSVCASMAYRYYKTRKGDDLFFAILMFVLCVLAIIRFIMEH